MKYLDEYRDPARARLLAERIAAAVRHPWVLMEVCGGQTHAIVRHGIDRIIPPELELVHGPGCPVCVTSLEMLDRAHAIAAQPGVVLASFGDMLRVPGSRGDLLGLRSRGADVRIVYSPLDALKIARANPGRRVVFFAVGFETRAPANAIAVWRARREGVTNFSMLVSQVLTPPVIAAVLQAAGRDGGRMPEVCDHCFVVKTWSIHRVQEVHTLLVHLLWNEVHVALGEDDVL